MSSRQASLSPSGSRPAQISRRARSSGSLLVGASGPSVSPRGVSSLAERDPAPGVVGRFLLMILGKQCQIGALAPSFVIDQCMFVFCHILLIQVNRCRMLL